MPRTARRAAPNLAHHIVQSGNNRQDIFFLDDDRRLGRRMHPLSVGPPKNEAPEKKTKNARKAKSK